ncbi:histidine triad (HIT) family protein [Thermoclostridium stercorarium subsp. stercorarium DSM 8532]|jgi:histidine triad (HIT) family protein|uniref:Histidine triad (HIT) family protein n=3 Tax=Thermoclostridium stercorarium TaxID=1510 RepID=L7VJU3_THES1|nr:histidine triad nucleotide-binding protein [Thermoclostridium stercorarium]AGC68390.1 histidine triad (HIT) family protein [Thermoclostridium stercorarium subsp. stercorarium DSM 8532]AGI39411.1 diadenosine tetraphosphate hydrolase [Thermoclostridium stercorarium subsp. stercorarium DSM 8532]ANW98751.1 histidine triad nucleotide-binding protein [Thermoclostridium stercorarium subsp. thermolacticum DSM 2910]ANX01268.1 histidine triad nucleotide-binding protein [Thermoclostridium stercorarium 
MSDCVFCKIINGEIPSSKVYENDDVIVFRDINPAAPVHVLVVPKVHIESLEALNHENIDVVGKIHAAILETTKILGINKEGYRVVVNCGKNGGQTVPHLHYHVLGGTVFGEKMV